LTSEGGIDLSELREALGTIVASYTYFTDPFSAIKETDIMIRYESAMLDAVGRFDLPADKEGHTYRELFTSFRSEWGKAVDQYSAMGAWKDSLIKCSKLMDNLMRIAVKENLLSVSRDMYNISMAGLGGMGMAPDETAGGAGGEDVPGGSGPTMPGGPPGPGVPPGRRPRR
jgi:hypothetical protein